MEDDAIGEPMKLLACWACGVIGDWPFGGCSDVDVTEPDTSPECPACYHQCGMPFSERYTDEEMRGLGRGGRGQVPPTVARVDLAARGSPWPPGAACTTSRLAALLYEVRSPVVRALRRRSPTARTCGRLRVRAAGTRVA